jgi:glycosyltransferase involved in cell wall biosynthesis
MACEVPVVVTDTGECRTVAGDAALVVPPRDPVAMADALRQLLREAPAARAARVARGRAHIAARWSLPAIAAAYAALWRRVAA